ncbi:hypothetical protein [Candidatus Bartonella washoeensis]|nr:hypothetical protein [Bartonella washoeensis]
MDKKTFKKGVNMPFIKHLNVIAFQQNWEMTNTNDGAGLSLS